MSIRRHVFYSAVSCPHLQDDLIPLRVFERTPPPRSVVGERIDLLRGYVEWRQAEVQEAKIPVNDVPVRRQARVDAVGDQRVLVRRQPWKKRMYGAIGPVFQHV